MPRISGGGTGGVRSTSAWHEWHSRAPVTHPAHGAAWWKRSPTLTSLSSPEQRKTGSTIGSPTSHASWQWEHTTVRSCGVSPRTTVACVALRSSAASAVASAALPPTTSASHRWPRTATTSPTAGGVDAGSRQIWMCEPTTTESSSPH
eukprot:4555155-Prymnesium_polylepis.1